jgi:hypothetical protein
MGTTSEKSCIRNNIFATWELSFIGNTGWKKRNEYWLAWLRVLHQKKIVKDLKHHLHINGVHLIEFECRRCFLVFPFLAKYLWMVRIPMRKWHNNLFLSSSNHAMILFLLDIFLFFISVICHQSHQSIFLYFIHQYLFPFEFLSVSFELCHQSYQSISLFPWKKWTKETTVVIASDVWKKNEERKQ